MSEVFMAAVSRGVYKPLEEYPQAIVDQLSLIKLCDNSVVSWVITNDIVTLVRVKPDNTVYTYMMDLPRLCVCLINASRNGSDSLTNRDGDEFNFTEMSSGIEISCNWEMSTILPVTYWEDIQNTYEDPVAQACKSHGFKRVGPMDHGGYLCPKCGYSNDAYTFEGACTSCGYGVTS